jgi:ribosomal protein S18 acetylase RimI-like enzyme
MVDQRTAAVEQVEATFMHRLVGGASPEVRARFGVTAITLGGGVCLAMSRDPSGYWSKTLGLGLTEPVTADLVKEVLAFYETYGGSSATIQIAPAALPEDWAEVAEEHGLEQGHSWVKLARDGSRTVTPGETSLRVGRVDRADVPEWAHVLLEGFGMPHELDPVFGETVDDDLVQVAAWDGDQMVAAASVFISGGAAQMSGAATLPTHRGAGAQSAMIALRLRIAQEAGVEVLSAETGVEAAGTHNPSLHNLRRAGFADLYERPNWIWRRRD